MKIFLVATTLTLLTTATVEAKPNIVAGVSEGLVVAFPQSGGVAWRPPATIFSLGLVVPMGEKWLWYLDLGLKTRNDVFNPAPQIVLGPGLRITSRVSVWLTVMYRYTPSYGGAPDTHITSLAIAPGITITPGVALLVGLSGGVNVSAGKAVPEFGLGPKLSFTLW